MVSQFLLTTSRFSTVFGRNISFVCELTKVLKQINIHDIQHLNNRMFSPTTFPVGGRTRLMHHHLWSRWSSPWCQSCRSYQGYLASQKTHFQGVFGTVWWRRQRRPGHMCCTNLNYILRSYSNLHLNNNYNTEDLQRAHIHPAGCSRVKSRNQNAETPGPFSFTIKCSGLFYKHYTTHGAYRCTSHQKNEAIMVKCLAQGHKCRHRPGRDSNLITKWKHNYSKSLHQGT